MQCLLRTFPEDESVGQATSTPGLMKLCLSSLREEGLLNTALLLPWSNLQAAVGSVGFAAVGREQFPGVARLKVGLVISELSIACRVGHPARP